MRVTAYIASNYKHVIADEGQLCILIEFALGFKVVPGVRLQFPTDCICFFYQLLLFKNIYRIDLIFSLFRFSIHCVYLSYV